ncbi:UDP-diphosphatase [Marinitoga sp. 1135]|uniref:Undecaprenyl-diphosphatase n=1 Tax=Marinitoga piezophila (strain DSM 14283 / JCM 11233 / KA3) TaxID=443254 RepID=H2J5Z3_MARPK|nr:MULTISPECIES: undecaprenyl-diphosphate phosphatase [Marinitoga]AEX86212.1 putative bacitracin resistance protein [Marinitoga piezophila KA3]APT76625.1 UDP-diphosphatase [Marinitoga sp. 1137]NUU96400.1 UDP-diphosphatase [Marinitoga sp. 1135]NUU98322.1 UDP-diphosphatase [Marinitoga sp. 1138]
MQEIILGIIQGLTEFLPVSSSGHLALFSKLINFNPDVSFFAFLHLMTFFAVLLFVYKEVWFILKGMFTMDKSAWNLALKIIVSSVPAAIIGILFEDQISEAFSSLRLVGLFFLFTSVAMILSDRFDGKKELMDISYIDAIIIGLFQAAAIFPGISRSGFTLFGALLLNTKKEAALKYSFLMSLPVTFGAGLLEINDVTFTAPVIYSGIFTFIFGVIGLFILKKTVINGKLKYFGYYTALAAIVSFIVG